MGGALGAVVVSVLLVIGNAFFVAAEYALVSARRSRLEAMARKGHRGAKFSLRALDSLSRYVAGTQIAITMFGIGVGAVTEPLVTAQIEALLGTSVPDSLAIFLSILIVTFVLVVVGELVPKYVTLKNPEGVATFTIRSLDILISALQPLVWLVQRTGQLLLRPFGIDITKGESDAVPKEELVMMVQAGRMEGILEKQHAEFVTRALKLDALDAADIMVHRLDMKWLDVSLDREALMRKLRRIPYTRLPVCDGDIDEVLGVAYLHDIVKHLDDPEFSLRNVLRDAVRIPESLSVEKIVATMRDEKTQILLVVDEYGGTSGIITLEDVVEEVFGELEDRIESERPVIETFPNGRVSARADVRLDELVSRLDLPVDIGDRTEPLAQVIVDGLGRIPRPGDSVESPLGLMRVENMARRRVTRVSVQLKPELVASPPEP